jgi:hypothetical protein
MAFGEARLLIRRPAREILDFVMDLRQYQKVDAKLDKIYWTRRNGNELTFRFRPRLLNLPGPPAVQRVVLTPGERIDISNVPAWYDAVTDFRASFECAETADGTWVTRRVAFTFRKPLSYLLEPLFDRWLKAEVPRELANAKEYLEAAGRPPRRDEPA